MLNQDLYTSLRAMITPHARAGGFSSQLRTNPPALILKARYPGCFFTDVITPPAEAGGFSGQLCGNPLAYVLKADIPA